MGERVPIVSDGKVSFKMGANITRILADGIRPKIFVSQCKDTINVEQKP